MHSMLLLVFSTLLQFVFADLPVHCLRHEIVGQWEFIMSPPSSQRSSCGHERPDNPKKQPPIHSLPGLEENDRTNTRTKTITLMSPNQATTDTDLAGSFTLIYDEGFEVVVDNLSFFAFSRFDLDSMGQNTTHCEETMTGWYHDQNGGNYGCYYGRKVGSGNVDNSVNLNLKNYDFLASGPDNVKDLSSKYITDTAEVSEEPLSEAFHHEVVAKLNAQSHHTFSRLADPLNLLQKRGKKHWKAKAYSHFVNKTRSELNRMAGIRRSIGLREAGMNHRRSRPESENSPSTFFQRSMVPKSVDWEEEGVLDPVINQGDCGSCYTVATTRMLSARRRISTKNPSAEAFSISFPLQCSEYNQGCDGGYAFLQSKWS